LSSTPTLPSNLLQRVSRSLFWNATLLPLISAANLITAVLIRRYFGLESGLYDLLLGLLNTVLFYSALGIPVSLTQFLPRLESEAAGSVTTRFLKRIGALRLLLAALILIPINLLPEAVGNRLHLGPDGTLLIRVLSVLIILRAANELLVRTLQSLLEHLRANLLQLLQAVAIAVALAATFIAGARYGRGARRARDRGNPSSSQSASTVSGVACAGSPLTGRRSYRCRRVWWPASRCSCTHTSCPITSPRRPSPVPRWAAFPPTAHPWRCSTSRSRFR